MNSSSDLKMRFIQWKIFLQGVNNLNDLINRSETFLHNNHQYYLVPFSKMDLVDSDRICLLTQWRAEHQYAYPTRFTCSEDRTFKWLAQFVLNNDNRVMFWVIDDYFKLLGHIGVARNNIGEFEIDNVLKAYTTNKGLFTKAQITLEKILNKEFNIANIYLNVLESNSRAVIFYKKLNYLPIKITSLIWKTEGTNKILVAGSPAQERIIRMEKKLIDSEIPSSRILTAGPSISNREIDYVYQATKFGWNQNHSDYIAKFENKFAEYVGSEYALCTSSCTGALHLALVALGIGPGDEVIVPDITWVATASAVSYVGATPVFADVDIKSWVLSVETIKKVVTKKTKAIIPVHLYGFGAPMQEIVEFANSKNIFVVEDAAPAVGTQIRGKYAGTFGQFGCFSFQGAKMLVSGEGGMIVTSDKTLIDRVRKLQDHGRKPGTFWIDEIGYKYKMNNLTAALGLAQIERVDVQIEKKRSIYKTYRSLLSDLTQLTFQEAVENTESICWMTSIQLNESVSASIKSLVDYLSQNNIDTRPVFPNIHTYPMWKTKKSNPNSHIISSRSINLPSGINMTNGALIKVTDMIRQWVKENV